MTLAKQVRTNSESDSSLQSTNDESVVKFILKKIPKMPSTVPRYLCEDGNCDTVHPNSRYNKRPKGKCNNCDQLNPHKEGKCLWCNQDEVESIDSEDLENMGIRLPD